MKTSNKKTIVMVLPDLKGNGAERVIMTLADGFISEGHYVHIILFKKFIELKSKSKFSIHIFKQHYRWIPKIARGLFLAPLLDRFIKKKCGIPNLILSNLLPVDRVLCRSKLDNVFFVIHNTPSYDLFKELSGKALINKIYKFSKIYKRKPSISVSKGVKEDFDSFFSNQKISNQIYNPIDTDFIIKLSRTEQNRTDYQITLSTLESLKTRSVTIY